MFDVVLETGFALREGLDVFGFDLALEVQGAEFRVSAAEAGDRFADLAIEGPIGRIDDPRRLRNRRGPIVHKAIQTVALPHISEEVFLRPSGEHGRSQTPRRSLVIGAENRGRAPPRAQLRDFAAPTPILK